MFYVYIIVSDVDGTLYTGQTANLHQRLKRHNQRNVKSSKSRKPFRLRYFEQFETRSEAMWREWELKTKWNTERKEKLICSFDQTKLEDFFSQEAPP